MNEIVKYNNDFNLLPMPELKASQMDIFMAILSLINEKRENTPFLKRFFNPELREIVIPQKIFIDLCRLRDSNMPYTDIFWLIDETLEKLVKSVIKYKKDEKTIYNFVCFEVGAIIASDIHITFTKTFYDMVINHKYGFTKFELGEFIDLNGKYTKTLYRLLKQYRNTGKMRIEWNEFMRLMDIPKTYAICDIDKQVLKPALKELTKERTLFDQTRIPFEKLSYTKIKDKGRGRGGKVVGIEFTFKPETAKHAQINDERKFDFEKLLNTKWYHRALGVFEIISGDMSDKTNLKVGYALESGDCGTFCFKNFNELRLKFEEFEAYAH